MERDFDTFDPNEALVDEGRNLYYPAGWQKGDPVFVLNDPEPCSNCGHPFGKYFGDHIEGAGCGDCLPDDPCNPILDDDPLYELEQRKGLDCE